MLIRELPIEIQEIVFQKQQEQGNEPNAELELEFCKKECNFNWDQTIEGYDFWEDINDGYFDDFYKKYPKKTKFKLGDKVKIINRHPDNTTGSRSFNKQSGMIAYVCHQDDNHYKLTSNKDNSGDYYGLLKINNQSNFYFKDSDLELIVEEPEINTYGLEVGDKLPQKVIREWGNQGLDVTVDVGIAQGWGRVTWGEGAWNESVPIDALSLNSGTVLLSGKAQVSLTGNDLQVQTGTLQFAGKATVDVTGNGLTLTIGNATVNQIVNASTTTNLLDILIQSPNIIAGGNITDAVVGQQLGVNVGTVGFKLDQIISVTGSSVQIGIGSVVIELPSIFSATGSSVVTSIGTATVFTGSLVDVTGSSVVLNSGDVGILAGAKVLPTGSTVSVSIGTVNIASIYHVTGNQVTVGTGTLTISTQTAVDLTGSLLTVGVGSPIIYGWNIINPTTGQNWSAINPNTGQNWVDIT